MYGIFTYVAALLWRSYIFYFIVSEPSNSSFLVQIAKLQLLDSKESQSNWSQGFLIGSVVEGKVQEAKDIGVVVSFEKYNDVFGFITHYQCQLFHWRLG